MVFTMLPLVRPKKGDKIYDCQLIRLYQREGSSQKAKQIQIKLRVFRC